ncbi:uncharacterized protein FOMMEDRAFT_149737 [Fomitiporia mediterranea MF3/22]|uniref:uncharacterized protein n=1 Tax=Fomitiporia mediterranea (strain MF3/22) TaxID=694068 RepID=UPI000440938F|nr:uncharacterized protein FOMMEDRAFT_149737 [Fomitiporia mediterranea MF3/22]EJD07226.1 hypothetical protein FOMMEDRAFT_149737 [Fomitiporia mediterranea MF3/22]
MPKLFGLKVRDIISTPGHLKLDSRVDSVKRASPYRNSTSASKDANINNNNRRRSKHTSLGSLNLLKKLTGRRKSTTSARHAGINSGEERRQLIDQRISDLSALLDAAAAANTSDRDRRSSWDSHEKRTSEGHDETDSANRSSSFRRPALRHDLFEPPATAKDNTEQVNEVNK